MNRNAISLAILLVVSCTSAKQPAIHPASKPASQPATETQPAVEPEVIKVLDNLEAAGKKHKTIQADVVYTVDMPQTGDSENRTGWVAYKTKTDEDSAKFRVHFKTLKQGAGRAIRYKVDVAFDGNWLILKKHNIKQITYCQVAAAGEQVEALRLGKGPFPIPFGQRSEDVLEYFEPSLKPLDEKDPKNTDRLFLKTRPSRRKELGIKSLEMWIDEKTHLPVKVKTKDKSLNITTVVFEKIKTNEKISDDTFYMKRPLGWEKRVVENVDSLSL